MTEVHRAEAVLLVPVEGEGAQGALESGDEGEVVGDGRAVDGPPGARGPAGRLHDAYARLGAQGVVQSAAVPGQFGETVEAVGEAAGRRDGVRTSGLRLRLRAGADRTDERRHVRREAPSVPSSVRAPQAGGESARQPFGAAGEPGVFLVRPHRRRPHPSDPVGQSDPALSFLVGGAAEGEEVELVLGQTAHQTVAPESGLTGRIRVTTVREESDPHEHTPDLPCGWPPLIGGSQRDDRMRTDRWCDGRLSVAPPKGVNRRNFPAQVAFCCDNGAFGHAESG